MRCADRRECEAFGGSPKGEMRKALRGSVIAITAILDDAPIAMFGVTPWSTLEGVGHPWMLGTDAVLHCARPMIKHGPAILGQLHARFRRLENFVSVENRQAIRLLRHWDFQFGDRVMIGGVEFVAFWRER